MTHLSTDTEFVHYIILEMDGKSYIEQYESLCKIQCASFRGIINFMVRHNFGTRRIIEIAM